MPKLAMRMRVQTRRERRKKRVWAVCLGKVGVLPAMAMGEMASTRTMRMAARRSATLRREAGRSTNGKGTLWVGVGKGGFRKV
jgi:hypothetical protein